MDHQLLVRATQESASCVPLGFTTEEISWKKNTKTTITTTKKNKNKKTWYSGQWCVSGPGFQGTQSMLFPQCGMQIWDLTTLETLEIAIERNSRSILSPDRACNTRGPLHALYMASTKPSQHAQREDFNQMKSPGHKLSDVQELLYNTVRDASVMEPPKTRTRPDKASLLP